MEDALLSVVQKAYVLYTGYQYSQNAKTIKSIRAVRYRYTCPDVSEAFSCSHAKSFVQARRNASGSKRGYYGLQNFSRKTSPIYSLRQSD